MFFFKKSTFLKKLAVAVSERSDHLLAWIRPRTWNPFDLNWCHLKEYSIFPLIIYSFTRKKNTYKEVYISWLKKVKSLLYLVNTTILWVPPEIYIKDMKIKAVRTILSENELLLTSLLHQVFLLLRVPYQILSIVFQISFSFWGH